MRIVFVCTGNTCRSSMAEGLARKWLADNAPDCSDISLTSAGLAALPGSPASEYAVEVMREAGIDLTSHRARQFSRELVRESDLILVMTAAHKRLILENIPEAAGKVFTLAEFAGGRQDVSDPFGMPVGIYRKCALEIGELVAKSLHKILKQQSGGV